MAGDCRRLATVPERSDAKCENAQDCRIIEIGEAVRNNLRNLWGDTCVSDLCVSLKVLDAPGRFSVKTYLLHTPVLCTSAYFKSRIRGSWRKSDSVEIEMDDPMIDQDAFEVVIRSLYGFDLRISKDNVLNVFATSAYFQIPEICERCTHFLTATLPGAPFPYVAQCCSILWGKEYPSGEELVRKCINVLATCRFDKPHLAQSDLLRFPPDFLREFLGSDNLWVPNEIARVEIVVQLLADVREAGLEKERESALVAALKDVLLNGVHYTCIPDDRIYLAHLKLQGVGDPGLVIECLKTHVWRRQAFHFAIKASQPSADEKEKKLLENMILRDFGWLRMGGEWFGIRSMSSREARNSQKVYYGGSIWWLQLTFELPGKDKDKDVDDYYGIFLMHEMPRVGDVTGMMIDRRDEIKAEIRVMCASRFGCLTRHAVWNVKKNRGWGWPKFIHQSKLHKFLCPNDSLRVSLAFRILID